jgi:HEAT repeat protein
MRRLPYLLFLFFGVPATARAHIDGSLTLGRIIADSDRIVVLQVDKVSREKQVIVFTKVADLKGKGFPDLARHQLTDGSHPRQARTILDWAEPGKDAVCFQRGTVCEVCIGGFWYECAAGEAPWWTMTAGKPELSYAYAGSTARLRGHVTAIVAGREVVVTALNFAVFAPGRIERRLEGWSAYEAVCSGRLMRGRDWPVWRIRASLQMPGTTLGVLQDPKLIAGTGAGGPDDVPALVKALEHDEARIRLEAAADLGSIGAPAAAAVPALLRLARENPEPLIRAEAAKAVALIEPGNEVAIPLLLGALKDKAGNVRKRAAECLGDLGPAARSAVPELVKSVKDADPTVSWASTDALGLIGPDAAEAVPVLVEAIKEAKTRGAAVDALGLIGRAARPGVPALEAVLEGDDLAARWPAAAALVRIGGPGAGVGTRFFLSKASPDGGRELYDAENILVAPAAEEALHNLLDAVRDPTVRDTATRILVDKSFLPLTKDQVIDARKCWGDGDPGVRCVAAWVLYCRRGQPGVGVELKDVLETWEQGLKASDPWARRHAARFVGSLGPAARGAVPALTAALEDKDDGVRTTAAEALKKIQQKPE